MIILKVWLNNGWILKKHIQLILVDDGSTDNSADIIKKWQKKYPNNIQYIYKENGGQASARNLGIIHAQNPWVTFIDPDDTVNIDYFYEVDSYLFAKSNEHISFIACNLIFYFEDKNCYSDTHPQKFKFESDSIYECGNLQKSFQLSASSSFFLTKSIIDNGVVFDEKVKPNFEDGHFIALYLLYQAKEKAAFLKKPVYFYRKRSDSSSTLDKSWTDERRYSDVFIFGYLDVLKQYKYHYNKVPVHVQRAVLYDMIWYLKKIINNDDVISFLCNEKKSNLFMLMAETFQYIDEKTINEFELAGCWFYHKVGILGCFKKSTPKYNIAYITEFDAIKSQALVTYYSYHEKVEEFYVNNQEVIPAHAKTIKHNIIDELFVYERRIWLPIPHNASLTINIGSRKSRISIGGKMYNDSLLTNTIVNLPKPKPEIDYLAQDTSIYNGAWLFMDRDTHADDNAEHLYAYISKNKFPQKIFYIIKRESHDWIRLQNEGFNLIEYGSNEHKEAMIHCSKMISSHADYFVTNFLGKHTLSGKHFVFLQHGVTKDDLSSWLNKKEHIDLFVTATYPEYQSIISDGTKYKFTTKEVKLTGFPRHDSLLNKSMLSNKEKFIVIMPTWRSWLAGKRTGDGSTSEYMDDFKYSNYAISWRDFLSDDRLHSLQKENDLKIVFVPHPNIEKYINELEIPSYIDCKPMSSIGIQDILASCSALITDYSSIAFEAAVINKPVIYYQFDEDEFFSGKHTYAKGYFDYRKDGFGPVIREKENLLPYIDTLVKSGFQQPEEYQVRIENTFPFRDGNSCQRTYDAILKLDTVEDERLSGNYKFNYALQATAAKAWNVAESRWKNISKAGGVNQSYNVKVYLVEALREQGKYTKAEAIIDSSADDELQELTMERILLATSRHQWSKAIALFGQINLDKPDLILMYIRCLAEEKLIIELDKMVLLHKEMPEPYASYISIWTSICKENWGDAIEKLTVCIRYASTEELSKHHPQLLLARCYRQTNKLDEAHEQLIAYEKHTKNNPQCREEIALLANKRRHWGKVYNQITSVYPETKDIPEPIAAILINALQQLALHVANSLPKVTLPETTLVQVKSLREKGHLVQAKAILDESKLIKNKSEFREQYLIESARLAMNFHNWEQAICYWEQLDNHDPDIGMARLRCLAELGRSKAIKRTLINSSWVRELPDNQKKFAESLFEYSKDNLSEATSLLCLLINSYPVDKLILHKPHLWLARCLRMQGAYDSAHKQLVEYEKIINNDIQCREQIALLSWARSNYSKVVQQLNRSYPSIYDMPENMMLLLFAALQKNNDFDALQEKAGFLEPDARKDILEKLEVIIKRNTLSFAA
ncbi:CDP-glycerol glycerophosphotransferase family protein [Aeromonas allosaccharophila]|uniref:CDP-glycerol glycerophosphotransferase family protein n=1 Tax=Aeromonas allosaccharophila TaxID=656 RepID=UPI003D24B2E4